MNSAHADAKCVWAAAVRVKAAASGSTTMQVGAVAYCVLAVVCAINETINDSINVATGTMNCETPRRCTSWVFQVGGLEGPAKNGAVAYCVCAINETINDTINDATSGTNKATEKKRTVERLWRAAEHVRGAASRPDRPVRNHVLVHA